MTGDQERRRAALFDLGGVLIDWNPRHLYRRLFSDAAAMEDFLIRICSAEWNGEQDAGRPFGEGVRLLVARHPELAPAIRAYDERWEEMLRGAIEESVAILDELRRNGVRCFALTNWSAEKFPIARRRFGFLSWFDDILVSGEVGIKKPDPRIFRLAIDRFDLDPAATLFIDDAPLNVAAARELGFLTHSFSGATSLRRAVVGCGLLAG